MPVATRVIPCLDVDAGRVVKGVNFAEPPRRRRPGRAGQALRRRGRRRADLPRHHRRARGDRETTYDVVRRTAEQVFIPLTVGGGVRTVDDVDRLLRAGADKVGVNTAAIAPARADRRDRRPVRRPGARAVGRRPPAPRRRGRPTGFEVTTHGGRTPRRPRRRRVGARAAELGAGEILLNSMDADGTKDGFDLELIRRVRARGDACPVIASGRRRAASSTSPRRSRRAPTPCSPRASSTSASCTIGQVKDALRAAGVTVR